MKRLSYLFLGMLTWLTTIVLAQSPVTEVDNQPQLTGSVLTWVISTWEIIIKPQKKIVVPPTSLPEYINETQEIRIQGFPEWALAHQLATRYYREAGRDMLLTMLWENGWFNVDTVSPTHDYWLCQLNYAASSQAQRDFINSPEFKDPQKQADYCIRKRNVAASKRIWNAYDSRRRHAYKVTIVDIVDDGTAI